MNVLAVSFYFIWIPMLKVYGLYTFFILSVPGSTSNLRIWRLKSIPALVLSKDAVILVDYVVFVIWLSTHSHSSDPLYTGQPRGYQAIAAWVTRGRMDDDRASWLVIGNVMSYLTQLQGVKLGVTTHQFLRPYQDAALQKRFPNLCSRASLAVLVWRLLSTRHYWLYKSCDREQNTKVIQIVHSEISSWITLLLNCDANTEIFLWINIGYYKWTYPLHPTLLAQSCFCVCTLMWAPSISVILRKWCKDYMSILHDTFSLKYCCIKYENHKFFFNFKSS